MLAICTDSLKGYGLNRIFEFTKQANYDGVELNLDPKNFDTLNSKYVKSLIDSYQIPILAISTPPTGNSTKIQEAIKIAKEINTKIIIIQPPKIFDFRYTQWLKNEIPKIRQKENISIALENSASQSFLGIIPENAMNSIVDLKNFKHVCLDTTRVAQKKDDLIRIYKTLSKYLVHIHLSNVKGSAEYYLPDNGILPIESFLTKLKQDNFAGNISIKVNPKFLNVGNDEKMLKTLSKIKSFYETYFIKIPTPNQSTS